MVLTALYAACLVATAAHAAPLRPDIRRMLAEPAAPPEFVPARVGWNGPETATAAAASSVPALERMGGLPNAKVTRAALAAAATPDPRAATALAAAILLLRWARHKRGRPRLGPAAVEEPPPEVRRAA